MNKEEAFVICFTNLKGSKDKELIRTAKALQYLRNLPEYNSNNKVGKAVGVSGEIVREFLTILKLPNNIQVLFEQKKLRRLEQARRLWQLARNRPDILDDTAKAISDMTAWDARHLVDFISRNPEKPVKDAKEAVMNSKTKIEHEFHVIALLSENEYRQLSQISRQKKMAIDALVTSIMQKWLEEETNGS